MSIAYLYGQALGGGSSSGAATKYEFEVTLDTVWSNSVPYTQTISVDGMLSDDEPHVSVVYSSDLDTALLEKEAYGKLSKVEAVTGGLLFTCFEEAPTQILVLKVEVIRNEGGDVTPSAITVESLGAAPAYTYGTEDLVEGESTLAPGTLYFVYEE